MMVHPGKEIGFEISVSGRDDGTLEAIYVRFSRGKIARTKEIQEDILLADYDANGHLIGLEILAPVRVRDLVGIVQVARRKPVHRFIKRAAPGRFCYGLARHCE